MGTSTRPPSEHRAPSSELRAWEAMASWPLRTDLSHTSRLSSPYLGVNLRLSSYSGNLMVCTWDDFCRKLFLRNLITSGYNGPKSTKMVKNPKNEKFSNWTRNLSICRFLRVLKLNSTFILYSWQKLPLSGENFLNGFEFCAKNAKINVVEGQGMHKATQVLLCYVYWKNFFYFY